MFNKVKKEVSKQEQEKIQEDINKFKQGYEKLCDECKIRLVPVIEYHETVIGANIKLERFEPKSKIEVVKPDIIVPAK